MSVNLFATQVAAGQQVALSGSGTSAILSNGLGIGGLGTDFWNIILGNVDAEGKIKVQTDGNDNALNKSLAYTNEDIKNEKANLALLQLALVGQTPDGDIGKKLAELKIERTDNRIEQLTKLVQHLTSGLPEMTADQGSVETFVANLEKRLEKLETTIDIFRDGVDVAEIAKDAENAPFQLLIATGLDPKQMTQITSRIQEVEEKLGRELTVEDLIAGVGNIIPMPKSSANGDEHDEDSLSTADYLGLMLHTENVDDRKAIAQHLGEAKKSELSNEVSDALKKSNNDFHDDEFIANQNQTSDTADAIASDLAKIAALQEAGHLSENNNGVYRAADSVQKRNDNFLPNLVMNRNPVKNIISKLNNLLQSTPLPTNTSPTQNAMESVVNAETMEVATESEILTPEQQRQHMKNAEFQALFNKGTPVKTNAPPMQANKGVMAALSNNMPQPKIVQNITTFVGEWLQPIMSEGGEYSFDIQTGMPLNNVSQAVHASTSIPQAGQTHPATQMVAANIAKAASSGQSDEITLELDPPELGRVKIKLEFGQEKSVKAHLIIEKPETFMMLQRDATALEKALQNAGLETDNDSLAFEFAENHEAFNNNGQGNNKDQHTGSSDNANDDSDGEDGTVIATTMTWTVDQETGHVRYNILA